MELSSSKDNKIAEIEMISMLATKCGSENFEFSQIYGVVWYCKFRSEVVAEWHGFVLNWL